MFPSIVRQVLRALPTYCRAVWAMVHGNGLGYMRWRFDNYNNLAAKMWPLEAPNCNI